MSVCVRFRWHPTKSLFFVNIYRHRSTLLTQYHLIPSSTELYWPSATKYQPVPPLTILTQYHHLPTSIAQYWPSTTLYQPVPAHTDPVPGVSIISKNGVFHKSSSLSLSFFISIQNWVFYKCQLVPPYTSYIIAFKVFIAHLMGHAQYTWSSWYCFPVFRPFVDHRMSGCSEMFSETYSSEYISCKYG